MIKTQYPYIDDFGNERNDLIKTYTDDPEHKMLKQIETGAIYAEAIDVYPCQFTYEEVDIEIEEEEEEETEE